MIRTFVATASLLTIEAAQALAETGESPADVHGGESAGGLPQFNPEWFPSQLFWLAVTFCVLYFFFARKILPALGSTIESRTQHVSGMMTKAETLTAEAKTIQTSYEKAVADASAAARQALMNADAEAKAKAAAATEAFRVKAEKQVRDAEASMGRAQTQALTDLQGTVGDIARIAAKRIADVDADAQAVQSALDQAQRRAKAA